MIRKFLNLPIHVIFSVIYLIAMTGVALWFAPVGTLIFLALAALACSIGNLIAHFIINHEEQ